MDRSGANTGMIPQVVFRAEPLVRYAELVSIARISLPSVVSAKAATICLVQNGSRVPISPACSNNDSALGGYRHHRGRVPARDLCKPTLRRG